MSDIEIEKVEIISRRESGAEEPWSICEAGWQVAVSEYVGRKEGGRGGGSRETDWPGPSHLCYPCQPSSQGLHAW